MSEKIINIQINDQQKKEFLEINKEFSKIFKTKDISYKIKNDELEVKLSELDLNLYKNTFSKIIKKNKIKESKFFQNLIDNIEKIKSYGIKGKKRIYKNYNAERKVVNRKKKVTNRGIHFYAAGNNFKKENNVFPQKFLNKIICSDSLITLKELPDNCVDLVFTSPPYNFGLEYSSTEDDHFWEKYFEKLFLIFDECIRVLKWGGRIIINIQPLFSDYIPSHHLISNFFIQKKLIWKGEILWEKNNYNCKYTAWGSWKSPSSPYLKYTWEFIEIFSKGSLKKDGMKDNIDISADEFKKWVVAKWSIAPERKMKELGHPAMFPTSLVERVLKLFSFENDIVLDPFNGVGTTSLVAKRLNRNYLGIDISKEYTGKAIERINSYLI